MSVRNNDHQYLNIIFPPNTQEFLTPAIYDQTLNQPILDKCSDYYCSVIRFQIPLSSVPVYIFQIDIFQNNPNVGVYKFGIRYLGVNYPTNVIWISTNNVTPPTPALTSPYFTFNQAISNYYFDYSVTKTLIMFNTAIRTSMTAAGLNPNDAPYYSFDAATQLISIISNANFVASGALLYFNSDLLDFIGLAFYKQLVGFGSADGFDWYYIFDSTTHPNTPYVFVQEYPTINTWSDLRKIVITSTTLPINNEINPSVSFNPAAIGNGSSISTGVSQYLPIVSDFNVDLSNLREIQTFADYTPTAQYRLIDMISNAPLQKLNFAIYWLDRYDSYHRIFLAPNQFASLKLLFVHKELYNNCICDKIAREQNIQPSNKGGIRLH